MKEATVVRDGGHWFVSICFEHEIQPTNAQGEPIGIDAGVAQSLTTSEGEVIQFPVPCIAETRLVKRVQRAIARKQKGSNRRRKELARFAKLKRRQSRRLADAAHKASTTFAITRSMIVIEDLKIRSMTASAKGTAETPGTNVAAKSGLNRSIMAQGHAQFRRMLAYKCERSGARLVVVDPKHTSQKCSNCGHTAKGNRPSQAEFHCLACNHKEHADVNAAKNIKAAGLAVSARGGIGQVAPKETRTRRRRIGRKAAPSVGILVL